MTENENLIVLKNYLHYYKKYLYKIILIYVILKSIIYYINQSNANKYVNILGHDF